MTFRIRQFPLENILLDVGLLLVAFALPNTNSFVNKNLETAFWIAAPIQVGALLCAFWNRDESGGRRLPNWLSSVYFLNCILAVGSFVWLYLVAFAVEVQANAFPYWGFRFAFGFALIGGILAYHFGHSLSEEFEPPPFARYLLILPVFVCLCFTESLLEVSIAVAQPTTLTVITATMISYLPVRLTLAFQPPFSYYDLASGLICFGIYLYSVV
ncbi:MAG: hypothetical protein ABL959_07640 [Pyrinomonadaceae bacterium]